MEEAVFIGENRNLAGIVHCPEIPRDGNPAVLFVNGGFLHKTGPYRLYTDSARELQQAGFYVLRFDFSGFGDSEQNDAVAVSKNSDHDIKAAVDYMANQYDCRFFAGCGLCSGADDLLEFSVQDERINALLFLDAPGFRTPRYLVNRVFHHYRHRLLDFGKWIRFKRRLLGLFQDNQDAQSPLTLEDEYRPLMESGNLLRTVDTLVSRSTKLHFIYTGGVFQYYNYAGQVFDMFATLELNGHVSESYHRDCDHMFLLQSHRQNVLQDMLGWFNETFPSNKTPLPAQTDNNAQLESKAA